MPQFLLFQLLQSFPKVMPPLVVGALGSPFTWRQFELLDAYVTRCKLEAAQLRKDKTILLSDLVGGACSTDLKECKVLTPAGSIHVFEETEQCVKTRGSAASKQAKIPVVSGSVERGNCNSILVCATNNAGIDVRHWLLVSMSSNATPVTALCVRQLKHTELDNSGSVSTQYILSWYKERVAEWSSCGFPVIYVFVTNRHLAQSPNLDCPALLQSCPRLIVVCRETLAGHLSPSLVHLALEPDQAMTVQCDVCKSWIEIPESVPVGPILAASSFRCQDVTWNPQYVGVQCSSKRQRTEAKSDKNSA
jgi:hypothetical protein